MAIMNLRGSHALCQKPLLPHSTTFAPQGLTQGDFLENESLESPPTVSVFISTNFLHQLQGDQFSTWEVLGSGHMCDMTYQKTRKQLSPESCLQILHFLFCM